MLSTYELTRRLALATLIALAASPTYSAATAASTHGMVGSAVAVEGRKSTWQVSLLSIRGMYRIPNTAWRGYKSNFYRFFVLTLRLTNKGAVAADPADDLGLSLKVHPPYTPHQMGYSAGFTILDRTDKVLVGMMRTAARTYGGAVPWTVARPGQPMTYCYVIGTNRGDSHYGLYNIVPVKRINKYLFDTGL